MQAVLWNQNTSNLPNILTVQSGTAFRASTSARAASGLQSWALSGQMGRFAYQSLLEEVYTFPKPGLVDPYSNGAHRDMDCHTFERSAAALEPYFVKMAEAGIQNPGSPERLFQTIRQIGIQAEAAMYQATGGVNTHKGAVFTIGILCAAAGACQALYGTIALSDVIVMEQRMVRRILLKEISRIAGISKTQPISNGQRNFHVYGALGVRGEAAFGYPSVTELALPVLQKGLREKRDWNQVKLQVLLTLMSQVEDGNVLSRTGRDGMLEVQHIAGEFLQAGGAYQKDAAEQLKAMDQYFIEKNYSNGGCADLLAAAVFLAGITDGNLCLQAENSENAAAGRDM
ncbi:MAG: triphosphoribosyl-dephospho-CoA synthase CitG [Lachnospiraceae bacterium]|nr:triphosphoribosyl-dephospho-CoA synthase CitG [Lachnospiraceae bacterium]